MAKSRLISVRRHPAGFFEALPGPGAGAHGDTLARFLQSDIQSDLAAARGFLDEIAAAERGEKPRPGGVGNAFSITIEPTGAVIRNAILETATPESYGLGELRAALETWIKEVDGARSDREGTDQDRVSR
jgi:hypothetical protein